MWRIRRRRAAVRAREWPGRTRSDAHDIEAKVRGATAAQRAAEELGRAELGRATAEQQLQEERKRGEKVRATEQCARRGARRARRPPSSGPHGASSACVAAPRPVGPLPTPPAHRPLSTSAALHKVPPVWRSLQDRKRCEELLDELRAERAHAARVEGELRAQLRHAAAEAIQAGVCPCPHHLYLLRGALGRVRFERRVHASCFLFLWPLAWLMTAASTAVLGAPLTRAANVFSSLYRTRLGC